MCCWNYCPCFISCVHPEPVTRVVRVETEPQPVKAVLYEDNGVQLSDERERDGGLERAARGVAAGDGALRVLEAVARECVRVRVVKG